MQFIAKLYGVYMWTERTSLPVAESEGILKSPAFFALIAAYGDATYDGNIITRFALLPPAERIVSTAFWFNSLIMLIAVLQVEQVHEFSVQFHS